MYIGDVSGCHDVPDPIWPRLMTFPALAGPIRTPIPWSDITSGPVFVCGPTISVLGIWLLGPGDGLAAGIGIFICWCGVETGEGEGDGEAIGIVECLCGVAAGVGDGEAAGIFIPGG